MIVKDGKRQLTSLAVAWIDSRIVYNMFQHRWIQKCIEVFGVPVNVFLNASMKQWNTELTAGNQRPGNKKIKRGIFQGGSLFPLLSVLMMIHYKVKKGGKKINHLIFMDDLKLFAKNKDEIDSLVNTVRIFSEDIKIEFGLPKCGVLIMKRKKVVKSEGISV